MVGGGRGSGRGRGKGRRSTIDDVPRDVRISKALTQILRHRAVDLGLTIRPDGYVLIQEVLDCKSLGKFGATVQDVEQITLDSDKRRFEIMSDQSAMFIRAVQGHSIKIVQDEELMRQLSPDDPDLPIACVHGTYKRHVQAILGKGLVAGGKLGNTFRNHVHFAPYAPGDGRVISGMRYDSDVAIWVNLREALRGGVPFFIAKNEVILSPGIDGVVPAEFIEMVCNIRTGEVLSGGSATTGASASKSASANASSLAPGSEAADDSCLDVSIGRSCTGNSPAAALQSPASQSVPEAEDEPVAVDPDEVQTEEAVAEGNPLMCLAIQAWDVICTWFSERPDSPALL